MTLLNFALLSIGYYKAGVARLRTEYPDAVMLVASDDLAYARLHFPPDARTVIVEETSALTLAILSGCNAGVIANSTFSWCAGFLVSRRGGRIVAPRYWYGWANKKWTLGEIETPGFEYLDPSEAQQAVE